MESESFDVENNENEFLSGQDVAKITEPQLSENFVKKKKKRKFHRFRPMGSLTLGIPWNPVTVVLNKNNPNLTTMFKNLNQTNGGHQKNKIWFQSTEIFGQEEKKNPIEKTYDPVTLDCHISENKDNTAILFFDKAKVLYKVLKTDIVNYDTLDWKLPYNEQTGIHMVPPTPKDKYSEKRPDDSQNIAVIDAQLIERIFTTGSYTPDETTKNSYIEIFIEPIRDLETFNHQLAEHKIPIPSVHKKNGNRIKVKVLYRNTFEVVKSLRALGYNTSDKIVKERPLGISFLTLQQLTREAHEICSKYNGNVPKSIISELKQPLWSFVIKWLYENKKVSKKAWQQIVKGNNLFDKGPILSESQTIQAYDAYYWFKIAPKNERRPEFKPILDWYRAHGRHVRLKKTYQRSGKSIGRSTKTKPRNFSGPRAKIYCADRSPYVKKTERGDYVVVKKQKRKREKSINADNGLIKRQLEDLYSFMQSYMNKHNHTTEQNGTSQLCENVGNDEFISEEIKNIFQDVKNELFPNENNNSTNANNESTSSNNDSISFNGSTSFNDSTSINNESVDMDDEWNGFDTEGLIGVNKISGAEFLFDDLGGTDTKYEELLEGFDDETVGEELKTSETKTSELKEVNLKEVKFEVEYNEPIQPHTIKQQNEEFNHCMKMEDQSTAEKKSNTKMKQPLLENNRLHENNSTTYSKPKVVYKKLHVNYEQYQLMTNEEFDKEFESDSDLELLNEEQEGKKLKLFNDKEVFEIARKKFVLQKKRLLKKREPSALSHLELFIHHKIMENIGVLDHEIGIINDQINNIAPKRRRIMSDDYVTVI